MRARAAHAAGAAAIAVAVAGLLVAGCGGGSKSPAATTAAPASTAGPASAPLAAYLLRNGEATFEVFAKPVQQSTVSAWAHVTQSAAADGLRVQREGFREALEVDTGTENGGQGLSYVLEVGSPAFARQETAVEFMETATAQASPTSRAFTVAGLPASHGVIAPQNGGASGNLYFVIGRCLVFVGASEAGTGPGVQAQVVAGAQAVYRRTASGGACTA